MLRGARDVIGQRTVWTVGHSNHSVEKLIQLLQQHRIDVVADVRTSPYSAYSTQFNKDELQLTLAENGIRFVFLGAELGGRPPDAALYDADGRVRYDLVSVNSTYLDGIERLIRGVEQYRVALLCGEEDPISCHRRRLVGRTLVERGLLLEHIRGDGSVSTEAGMQAREAAEFPERFQLTLDGPPPWRSEHPVRRKDTD